MSALKLHISERDVILQEGKQSCHRNVLCLQQAPFRCSSMAYHTTDPPIPNRTWTALHMLPLCVHLTLSLWFSRHRPAFFHETVTNEKRAPPRGHSDTAPISPIKRKKGQAGSFTAKGDTLQMSPPACFTARLHYSIPCGKANQTPSCRLSSDPARAPHMHSGEGEVSSRGIKQVPDGTTGYRHRWA